MEELQDYLIEKFNLKETNVNVYSPLVLAYIGDAIYEVLIRTLVVNEGNCQVNKMHLKTREYVKASAQATMYFKIEPYLTPDEVSIFKRGRNAKSATKAKNASVTDYRNATGFEALIGYLYLNNEYKRIVDLLYLGIKNDETD
jgi:ribonuclease-3 family protein